MDRHLNLFYSYNRDSELIENNLTRAFIVTLQAVSPTVRDWILRELLVNGLDDLKIPCPSFADAEFALQGYMEKERARRFTRKVVLTIATDLPEDLGSGAGTPGVFSSIPDAWIIAGDHCFLIEAKVGTNPLNENQVVDHAWGWFELEPEELTEHHIGFTWYEVRRVLDRLLDGSNDTLDLNEQERILLRALGEFLEYFGYLHFNGLPLQALGPPPRMWLHQPGHSLVLNLTGLGRPPTFALAS